ncbi:MAG: hypothetical protein SFU27_10990, partial [Thermonemataceae bacterium]|nr:hypothetical protein [Thermonemataceae bacterium]
CTKNVEPDDDKLGYSYFPLEIGNYIIYQVQEKDYVARDTTSNNFILTEFQLKEVVIDTFTNLSGQKEFVLERYVRTDENAAWQIDSVWAAVRTGSQAIKYENNTPYVKLLFPTANDLNWNGNAYNNYGEKTYRITDYRKNLQLGELFFPNSLKVLMGNDSSLVSQIKREEIYVLGVGMAMMERINVRFRADENNLGKGLIESGKAEKYTLIGYGKE